MFEEVSQVRRMIEKQAPIIAKYGSWGKVQLGEFWGVWLWLKFFASS